MKILPIADCRLPINGSFAGCRLARGCHDGNQAVGFFEQGGQLLCGYDFGLNQQFEPQCRFVGFFFNRTDFGDEFRPASRATRRAIIRGHRDSAANDLLGNDPAGIVNFWNRAGQFDDSQRKGLGTSFEFNWVHGVKLQIQSAIGNRQSAIAR